MTTPAQGQPRTGGRTGGRTQQAAAPQSAAAAPSARGGRTQQGAAQAAAAKRTGGTAFQGRQAQPSARTGGRTQQGSQPRRTGGRTQQGTQGGKSVRPGPAGRQGGSQRRGGSKPAIKLGKGDVTSYQAVILAEFVAAILLVAATPFAKKDQPGASPYVGADLLQLVALTVTYFVLALISGASRGAGRFAAWFGALILLTVGLAEAARLAKLLNVFGLSSPPGAVPDSTGTGQAPGTTTAGGRGG